MRSTSYLVRSVVLLASFSVLNILSSLRKLTTDDPTTRIAETFIHLVSDYAELNSSAIPTIEAISGNQATASRESVEAVVQLANSTNVADESQQSTHSNSSTEDAIFYHIYINITSDVDFALGIVKEQLQQVLDAGQDRIVYYTLIGGYKNMSHTDERFCLPGLKCIRLRHVDSGFEEVTLSSLYDYCATHPTARVTYIHSKGTHHSHPTNHLKRQVSTRVVLSNECRTFPPTGCNVCTTHFTTRPHWHTPGNFWTADCSYIRKLIPPGDEYESKRVAMFDELFDPQNANKFKCLKPKLKEYNETYNGKNQRLCLGRFLNEYWIWNHPDLLPCDAFPKPVKALSNPDTIKSEWSPKLSIPSRELQGRPMRNLFGQGKWTWSRMIGKLYEMRKLYGRDPAEQSPLWKILLPLNDTVDGCEPEYSLLAS